MPSFDLPSSEDRVQVTSVTLEPEFAALKDGWNELVRRSIAPSVFLSHEWFEAAWAWRRLDSTLEVQVARKAHRLIAILPLIRPRTPKKTARCLELLTVPDTQVSDMIALPDAVAEASEAFAAALAAGGDWDILRLGYLAPSGAAVGTLTSALARRSLWLREEDGGRNSFIVLSGSWKDYYGSRSRRLKKANNLAGNRLQKVGAVKIDHFDSSDGNQADFGAALETVIDISRRSWKRTTGNSLDRPGPQAFIRSLSHAAKDKGWLSIWLIHVGPQALAMEYQLVDDGKVHALRADFDASCTDISPGSVLFRQLLERSFERGLLRYYMGPGENPYKKHWTDQGEPLQRFVVYNRTLRGRTLWLRDSVAKPLARAVRDRLFRARQDSHLDEDVAR